MQCPICGMRAEELKPEAQPREAAFGMVECLICGYVGRREHFQEDADRPDIGQILQEVAENLDRAANGRDRTVGECKRTMRSCRDDIRELLSGAIREKAQPTRLGQITQITGDDPTA